MKKLLFITMLIISNFAFGQVPYASEYPVEKNVNWRFRNNDTVTFHQLAIENKGRWLPNGQIDYIAGLGPYTWPTSITAGTKIWSIDGTSKVISFIDYTGIGLGDGSFLGLDDTPDDYTGHANQLTFINDDEDSLIFTKGLQWNGLLDSALLIINDDINSGFAHLSNDGSQYATFNYRNIGLTDGSTATNIFPSMIMTPNIRWGANESYFNWDMPTLLDFEDGPILWHWHAEIGDPGSVLADPDGDGNIHMVQVADIFTETDPVWIADKSSYLTTAIAASTYVSLSGSYANPSWLTSLNYAKINGGTSQQILYFNSSGIATGNSLFLFDDSDYTFSIGSTNSENYNFSITDPTARAENVTTGFNAETLMKLRYANGSAASPTAVQAGDAMGIFGFAGHDGTAYTSDVDGGMKMIATENWTTGAHGNYLLFAIKATGSNTLSKKMRLDENGLNIGAFGSHSYMLDVNGDVNIASGSNYKINGTNISTSNVTEGSNLYYTNERVDDEVDALIVDGTNITTSYNDAGNALTINSSYKTIVGGNANSVVSASTTSYAPIFSQNSFSTTESQRQMVMPFAGTASNLYFVMGTNQPASGNMVVTVRKNGVATALTFTIAANASAATFSDTTHSFTFVAGDILSLQVVNNATGNSGGVRSYSFMIQ